MLPARGLPPCARVSGAERQTDRRKTSGRHSHGNAADARSSLGAYVPHLDLKTMIFRRALRNHAASTANVDIRRFPYIVSAAACEIASLGIPHLPPGRCDISRESDHFVAEFAAQAGDRNGERAFLIETREALDQQTPPPEVLQSQFLARRPSRRICPMIEKRLYALCRGALGQLGI